jgi:uncharacterized protein (DUF2141 family)
MKRSTVLTLSSILVVISACGAQQPAGAPAPTIALSPGQTTLTVKVERVKADKGPVFCDLFNAGEGFPGPSPIIGGSLQLNASSTPMACTFSNLPSGAFAVSVTQDENGNGTIDLSVFGAPIEGYGASNNLLPATSAPTFADSKVDVDGVNPLEITVRLQNTP